MIEMSNFPGQILANWLWLAAGIAVIVFVGWAILYRMTYAVRSQILGITVWHGRTETNLVALTFDDGPAPETNDLLDVLRTNEVKAVFFLIGRQVEKYPEIVRRIVAEGHEIGNHSYSHPIYLFCSRRRTKRELFFTQKTIERVTGKSPTVARPPCGVRSLAYFAATKKLGLNTIQWSDTGFDWKKISAEQIATNVLKTVQAGSIILLHDGDSAGKHNRYHTIAAIPLILQGLKKKNLHVAPLARLLSNKKVEVFANGEKAFD